MYRGYGKIYKALCHSEEAISAINAIPIHSRSQGGAVAQLGERDVRNVEVRGSIPLGSTTPLSGKK